MRTYLIARGETLFGVEHSLPMRRRRTWRDACSRGRHDRPSLLKLIGADPAAGQSMSRHGSRRYQTTQLCLAGASTSTARSTFEQLPHDSRSDHGCRFNAEHP